MIETFIIDGLPVQTGDLLATTDGNDAVLRGEFWRLLGRLVPGDVDHIVVYVGPGGRCVEAGPHGVITFEMPERWDATALKPRRGFLDTLYGVIYPLAGHAPAQAAPIRAAVAAYCLAQAAAAKPYNLNFLDSRTETAFYCSQLAYLAYLPHGIDLNTGQGIPTLAGTESIIFPQEIWAGFPHRQRDE